MTRILIDRLVRGNILMGSSCNHYMEGAMCDHEVDQQVVVEGDQTLEQSRVVFLDTVGNTERMAAMT